MATVKPYGLTRMRPFPKPAVVEGPVTAVLDPDTQTAVWNGSDEHGTPTLDRHKRSQTVAETKPKTSLDGEANADEGNDQEGDQD
ncbi:putative ATP-grasp-modified RiPP [Streptomyces sp. NPDC056716]|uniref:putative ATP-grasp-modified RiPP n=1 Tax=unclassified Streptomyces TaxID=2593676 RepID=UPI0036B3A1A6